MAQVLLVDFGTTSVKTAIVDLDTGVYSHVRSHTSVPDCAGTPGHYEMAPLSLQDRFRSICTSYYSGMGLRFEGIFICSEQNGFLVLDPRGRPTTNYVSWKDERSLEPIDGLDTFSLLTDRLGDEFKTITGWRPGPGLPIMNVTHLARQSRLATPCKILTLPEWLALCSNDSMHVVHDTMLHGLCFYDVQKQQTSNRLVELVAELTGVTCTFNEPAATGAISGYWHSPDRPIPIYAGIGDHQCSVLGAGNMPRETISVNIGTGSQVAVIEPQTVPEQAEHRPYFDGHILAAVTRIPGGRALAGYVEFLEDVCRSAGVAAADFWSLLQEVDEAGMSTADLEIDLAIFGSAWGYAGGGSISGIHEGSFTLDNFLASLLRSFARQYAVVMALFDPQHIASRCVLSGGVARRLPVLAEILYRLSGYATLPASAVDESLMGLRTVALIATGRAHNYIEAEAIFGRSHLIEDEAD
jgi:sedoheptulokinase